MSLFIAVFARLIGYAGGAVGDELRETTSGAILTETTTGFSLTES